MNRDYESKFQDACRRLVNNEVYCCVSSLMSDLYTLVNNASSNVVREMSFDSDDIADLMSDIDWDEAVSSYLEDEDYLKDTIEDHLSYDLGEYLKEKGIVPLYADLVDIAEEDVPDIQVIVEEGDPEDGFVFYQTREQGVFPTYRELFDAVPAAHDAVIDAWLQRINPLSDLSKEALATIRLDVESQITDKPEFCSEMGVGTDGFEVEVYEHWIVSDWLGRQLESRGYKVREISGMTVWGRTCTGQAILLDGVIRDIVRSTDYGGWDDEAERAASLDNQSKSA